MCDLRAELSATVAVKAVSVKRDTDVLVPFNFHYALFNSSGLHFHSHLSACLWHWQQML